MKHAFMIAATGSGCGKTTITCALLKAFLKKGMVPKSYKCGPDYIDPMFHKAVLGIASENLDLFFSDTKEVNAIFYGDTACEIGVVEGVMGLYDGIDASHVEGSSYDLACKLDLPIILVVNAKGMGRSLLAVLQGFLSMDYENRIKGVLLNQISPMYYTTIGPLIEKELGVAVLGYFPHLEQGALESRYLGLKLPGEIKALEDRLAYAATTIAKSVDLERVLALTKCEKFMKSIPRNYASPKVRIGIARDEAFCFFYEENMRLLQKLGAELIEFSPLKDDRLPEGIDGLLLGGGYPELHAKRLSENTSMCQAIKTVLEQGMPSLAECGGFMYLHESIEAEGTCYPMVGLVEGSCWKKNSLVRFGYLTLTEKENVFMEGEKKGIKGHEFHYYDSTNNGCDAIALKPVSGRSWEAAHIRENHWWGFAHLYYPSNPAFAVAFIEKCLHWRKCHEAFL